MTNDLPIQRVEVSFVGAPPARQIERASGVSDVEVNGATLRCIVFGSFQPFLEALLGHEVIILSSTPARAPKTNAGPETLPSAPSGRRLD